MFLNVPVRLSGMNDEERRRLGERVRAARLAKGWPKERAAEEAEINPTTLRRIESGLRVQDAKLQMVLNTLGLTQEGTSPEKIPEEHWSPMLFELPPEIERGYNETVRFTSAVVKAAPQLRPEATRLMVQAANLFARAGDIILSKGGDGDGDSAPTKTRDDFELIYDEDEVSIEDEQGHDETP